MNSTILFVEDEENDVLFLQRAFKKAGITNPVQVARDGREALDYFHGTGKFSSREKYPLPCLVLLDLKLPYVVGLDVLKSLRTGGYTAVVLILSSSTDQEEINTAFRLGANAYLVKPNETDKLAAIARAIQDFWLLQNQFPTPCETKHAALNLRVGAERSEAVAKNREHQPRGASASGREPDPAITYNIKVRRT